MNAPPNPTVTVFDPTANEATRQDRLAPRMETLDGKLIGLLDNKFCSHD